MILHALFPHDKSIWAKIRNPLWWLFTLVGVTPVYGVAQCWFLFLFLLKDKSDEFQLVSFIVTFKSSMFVAVGVLPTIKGE